MEKKIAGLLGAAAALTTMTAAQGAMAGAMPTAPASIYRDLLEPIPNALAALKADDARMAQEKESNVQLAQYYYHHHHHHHHHFRYYDVEPRGFYHHHHHHHHHRGFDVYIR